jgi:glycine cleavage system H protein
MTAPANLCYTKTHEWVREENGTYFIGITDHAQSALGDIVFLSLPAAGDKLKRDEAFSDIESVKAVSSVFSPVSGTVLEANEALLDSPDQINRDPYGAWLVKVADVTDKAFLLSAEEYEKFLAEEDK